jgi:hypothetical protein
VGRECIGGEAAEEAAGRIRDLGSSSCINGAMWFYVQLYPVNQGERAGLDIPRSNPARKPCKLTVCTVARFR